MIPRNEQETIALFAQLAPELGYQFKEMGIRCPDAIMLKDGKEVRVEFEHTSLNFKRHKHNPDDVDLIICWQADWQDCPLPVLPLETYLTLSRPVEEVPQPSKWQCFIDWWKQFRLAWIEARSNIKQARMLMKAERFCKSCGAKLVIKTSGKGDFKLNNGKCCAHNYAFYFCPDCGYRDAKEFYENI